jgi:hypothetical protein
VSVWGARGDLGDGLFRAWRMSCRQLRMMSVDELLGNLTLLGNHVRVSMIRRARVPQIQTL